MEANQLILYMEVVVVYSETYKDHLSIICGQKG